jgi:hypothetical protein
MTVKKLNHVLNDARIAIIRFEWTSTDTLDFILEMRAYLKYHGINVRFNQTEQFIRQNTTFGTLTCR